METEKSVSTTAIIEEVVWKFQCVKCARINVRVSDFPPIHNQVDKCDECGIRIRLDNILERSSI